MCLVTCRVSLRVITTGAPDLASLRNPWVLGWYPNGSHSVPCVTLSLSVALPGGMGMGEGPLFGGLGPPP